MTGFAATLATTETKVKVDALILGDCHIISEICAAVGIVNRQLRPLAENLATEKFATGSAEMLSFEYKTAWGGGRKTPVQNFSSAVAKAEMLFFQKL